MKVVLDYLDKRAGVSIAGGCSRFCVAALIATVLGVSARAAEVPLQEAYSRFGQLGIYESGVGVVDTLGTGTISGVNVGGPVEKAFLYWVGSNRPHDNTALDPTVTFTPGGSAGTSVTADNYPGYVVDFEKPFNPGSYYWDANHIAYFADVTQLVSEGVTEYTVSDFTMDDPLGVGLQIIYADDSLPAQEITIFQGHDYAYSGWPNAGELNRTVVLSHTFEPADYDRQLDASFLIAGAADDTRSARLWYVTGEHTQPSDLPTELITNSLGSILDADPLAGINGNAWDTLPEMVTIPAGATYVAFQFESGTPPPPMDMPESFSWISGSFSIVPEPATLALFSLGALTLMRRRQKAKRRPQRRTWGRLAPPRSYTE